MGRAAYARRREALHRPPPRTVDELLEYLAPEMVSGRRPSWHAKAACIGSSVAFFSEKPDDVTAARARYPVLRGSKTA